MHALIYWVRISTVILRDVTMVAFSLSPTLICPVDSNRFSPTFSGNPIYSISQLYSSSVWQSPFYNGYKNKSHLIIGLGVQCVWSKTDFLPSFSFPSSFPPSSSLPILSPPSFPLCCSYPWRLRLALSRSMSLRRRSRTVRRRRVRSHPQVTGRWRGWVCRPWWRSLGTCLPWTWGAPSCTLACRSTCRPSRTLPSPAVSERAAKSTWPWGFQTTVIRATRLVASVTSVNQSLWPVSKLWSRSKLPCIFLFTWLVLWTLSSYIRSFITNSFLFLDCFLLLLEQSIFFWKTIKHIQRYNTCCSTEMFFSPYEHNVLETFLLHGSHGCH